MLEIATMAALILTAGGFLVLMDRKDKRHDAQLTRLLVHVQAPERAVQYATSTQATDVLYLPPEDDKAWNAQHGIGE